MSVVTRVVALDGRAQTLGMTSYSLRVTSPGKQPRDVEVHGPIARIGSREGADVQVDDPAVSRLHAVLRAEEHGLRLSDLGSRNGTFANGLRIIEAFVSPWTLLQVGQTELLIVPIGGETPIEISASDRFGEAVGRSAAIRQVFATLGRAAPTRLTILIEGETGTGKELLAEAVHGLSDRSSGPFVICDCAALAPSLIESELFGHERGAFTGAAGRHIGFFEQASGGTLFLDEVGELPLELQARLLGAIERQRVRRIGGCEVEVDARVIAATNRDLARMVNRDAFREDLYYRLAVVQVRVPPLRERPEDIPDLVEYFLRQACGGEAEKVAQIMRSIPPEQWSDLCAHSWPGNVRALRNFVERTVSLAEGWVIEPQCRGVAAPTQPPDVEHFLTRPLTAAKMEWNEHLEHAYLTAVLEREGGNYSRAARAAGVERMHFKRMLRKHGLID